MGTALKKRKFRNCTDLLHQDRNNNIVEPTMSITISSMSTCDTVQCLQVRQEQINVTISTKKILTSSLKTNISPRRKETASKSPSQMFGIPGGGMGAWGSSGGGYLWSGYLWSGYLWSGYLTSGCLWSGWWVWVSRGHDLVVLNATLVVGFFVVVVNFFLELSPDL